MAACFCTGACSDGKGCGARAAPQAIIGVPHQLNQWPFYSPSEPSPLKIGDWIPPPKAQPEDREKPGFHPLDDVIKPFCTNPGHYFPTHLYIPAGSKYVHYCPACGQKSVTYGSSVTC